MSLLTDSPGRRSGPELRVSSLHMQRTIHIALYGSIDHAEQDLLWDCFQTEPLARLRDISLSSTPSRFAPHGMAASRFHHSVGVAHLADKLCDLRQGLRPYRKLLTCAALCHDIGSPPFSHISELFFWDATQHTHEQQTAKMLAPGTELNSLMEWSGVDGEEVVQVITGNHDPLGPLLAGSIDLDNLDNSLHLLRSLGYDYAPYHPLRLLKAFRFRNGKISLDSGYLSEILGWAEARRALYDLLHAEPNLSSATMLYRALEFGYANGALDESFFALGESDALYHLRSGCGEQAAEITDLLLRWKQYPLVYAQTSSEEDPRLVSLYDDWGARKRLTDRLADELGLRPQELAFYVGRDRGAKNIDLPFIGEHAQPAAALFENRKGSQRVAVFAHKRCRDLHGFDALGRVPKVEEAVTAAVSELPEAPSGGHIFF